MVRIFKSILRTLFTFLVFAIASGLIVTFTDYIWSAYYQVPMLKENFVQRVGYYSSFLFALFFMTGIFLFFILSDWIYNKYKNMFYINVIIFLIIGVLIGILTQGDGFALYNGPAQRWKHILSISISLGFYNFISKISRNILYKSKQKRYTTLNIR